MKKTVILLLIAGFLMIAPLTAETRVDIGVNIPTVVGISFEGENVSEEIPFVIPVPDLMYNYYFGTDFVKIGAGFRVWTLIVFSAFYPIVSAEIELDRVVLNANIGGGAFWLTGIGINEFGTGRVFLPEISASYRFTDWFSLGASVLGVYLPDVTDEGFGYSVNILGRFRVK